MSSLTFYFGLDLFDLKVNPDSDRISDEKYELLSQAEKLQLHKTTTIEGVEAQLKETFKIEATTNISSVVPMNGFDVLMEDFNLPVKMADVLMTEIENAIFFHPGFKIKLGPDHIRLTLKNSTLTK